MFTGIVEEIGTIIKIKKSPSSAVITVSAYKIIEDLKLGDSIAVNGVCLTVTSFTSTSFTADIMHETLNRSSLKNIKVNSKVNLERAMLANGRFGGHIVSGHIDGLGTITEIIDDDNAKWFWISTSEKIMRYVIEKGSITIDGISLTIAKVRRDSFAISIIPHTAKETILSLKSMGDEVNLENDIVGKYIERFLNLPSKKESRTSKITKEFLSEYGF